MLVVWGAKPSHCNGTTYTDTPSGDDLRSYLQSTAQQLMLFENAVDRYLRFRLAEGKKAHSYHYLVSFWKPTLQGRYLREITTQEIEDALSIQVLKKELSPFPGPARIAIS